MDERCGQNIERQKKLIRTATRKVIAQFCTDSNGMALAAKNAANNLFESSIYIKAHVICTFVACSEEIETRSIIEHALADGKRVAVPRVTNDSGIMEFYYLDASRPLDMQFETGSFGLIEPNTTGIKIETNDFPPYALFLMPGLAFTCSGKRLGRGRGFYDRYIARIGNAAPVFAAFCFSCQIVDDVPSAAHDVDMSYIVCERGVISCSRFQHDTVPRL